MRDIKGTTLEHVILNSTKTKDKYDEYFQMESELEKDNMMLAKDFLENPKEVPPFPHTIAYENLIPSCFGYLPTGSSKCCNNYRGEKFVHPLVFRKNISAEEIVAIFDELTKEKSEVKFIGIGGDGR